MPSPFESWTIEQLKRAIAADLDMDAVTVNRRMFEGDMWLDGEGWVGPRPAPGEEGADDIMELLRLGFVSKNIVAEVCERHMTGVVGTEPAWAFVPARFMAADDAPTPEEETLIQEVEENLTWWTNKRRSHALLQDAIMTVLWAKRSTFRLRIPAGMVTDIGPVDPSLAGLETDDNGNPVQTGVLASDLRAALDLIFPQRLEPEFSAVVTDPDTMREAGVFLAKNQTTGTWEGELVYLDDDGSTVLRPIVDDVIQSAVPIPLGGRLTFFEIRRRLLITPQVVQQQKAYNLAVSCIPRTVITSGFLERVLLNAQMPGEWERDADGNPIRFVPAKYVTGGGSTQFVQGIEIGRDPQTGEVKLSNPSVQWRDPGQVLMPVQAKEAHYRDILDECDQAHILAQNAASPSGVSREQARAGYEKSLELTQPEAQNAVVWMLEGALALAEYILGQPGRWTSKLRCVCDARIDSGPVTPDEERVVTESVEKGMMSEETGMSRLRIPDVDAEKVRIMRQPGARLGLLKRQADVLAALVNAGFDLVAAGRFVGFDEAQIKQIEDFVVEQEAKAAELAAQQQEQGGPSNEGQLSDATVP
jgi:hypothetical protein